MVIYKCDACGKAYDKPYALGERASYDAERNGTLISRWRGDLCKECFDRVDYEMNRAAIRTIEEIGNEAAQEGRTANAGDR